MTDEMIALARKIRPILDDVSALCSIRDDMKRLYRDVRDVYDHERILYNEAKRALEERGETGGIPTQQLLFPAHLELTPGQVQAWQTHAEQMKAMGFTIEPFGGQSILVQGIPASLKNWNEGRLLLDMLDDLAWDDKPSQENQVDLLASYACHGAVRAGEPLTIPEMQNLVDQLFATDTPLSCPHGRPTLIQYTLEELEKRFGRT